MRHLIILIFLLFSPLKIYSQIDTTRLNFYPLEIGNAWQYKFVSISYEYSPPETLSVSYHNFEIEGDTLMPNGQNYFGPLLDYVYRRVDSISGCVYEYDEFNPANNYESVVYDLSIIDSTSWIDGRGYYYNIHTSTSPQPVGLMPYQRIITLYLRHIFLDQDLAEGFGLSILYAGGPYIQSHVYLIWARIKGVEYGTMTNLMNNKDNLIENMKLCQNYPNPFNSETTIEFYLSKPHKIEISIFDLRGRLVERIINEIRPAGPNKVKWDGNKCSSGIYYYQLKSEEGILNKRLLLLK